MKKLLILASMLAAPASVYAQGLPIDFDPQQETVSQGSDTGPEASVDEASRTRVAAARSVRHGEHKIMLIDRSFTGPANAKQAQVASVGS